MLRLLKKDLCLAMHPITPVFLLLSAMVMIPNYPYSVVFFYTFLSLFFTCLSGRENDDVLFCLTLPVRKADVARARIAYAVLLQAAQLLLMIPFALISNRLLPPNQAGLCANVAFFGWGLFLYAIGNLAFFEIYYRQVRHVERALIGAAVPLFLCIMAEVIATHAIPFVRDVLNTKDPAFALQKWVVFAVGLAVYVLSLFLCTWRAVRHFEKQDI